MKRRRRFIGKASRRIVLIGALGCLLVVTTAAKAGELALGLNVVDVAGVGNIVGDATPDVLHMSPAADNNGLMDSGSAYVVTGKATTQTVDLASFTGSQAAGFRIDAAGADDRLGTAAGAGEVNGSGPPDMVVGAQNADNNGSNSGSAYVVFGKTTTGTVALSELDGTPPAATPGFRIDGAGTGDNAARSVASAGDVNNDGLDDVIVGAPGDDNNGRNGSGSAFVVFGKASTANVNLNTYDGTTQLDTDGFRIDGAAAFDSAGRAVAAVGDLNGDNLDDVVVGASDADNNSRSASGSAYVVFGKANNDTVDLATFDGTQTTGYRIDGAISGEQAGLSLASTPDMNADGRRELIVGAPNGDRNGRGNSGTAYLVFGQATTGTIDLNTFTTGFRIEGAAANDQIATAVSSVGDQNGDGTPDIGLGAPYADPNGRTSGGSAYVVYGKTSQTTIDLNTFTGAQTTGFRIDGATSNVNAGASVAGVGDMTGDSRPELMVLAPVAGNNDRVASGSSYIVFGRASPTNLDLNTFTGSQTTGYRIDGARGGDGVPGAYQEVTNEHTQTDHVTKAVDVTYGQITPTAGAGFPTTQFVALGALAPADLLTQIAAWDQLTDAQARESVLAIRDNGPNPTNKEYMDASGGPLEHAFTASPPTVRKPSDITGVHDLGDIYAKSFGATVLGSSATSTPVATATFTVDPNVHSDTATSHDEVTTVTVGGITFTTVTHVVDVTHHTTLVDTTVNLFNDSGTVTLPTSNPPPGKPPNDIEIGKAKLNKKKGTATLPVTVPGPGQLELVGKKEKPATSESTAEGTVSLPVKPAKKTAKKLKKRGKAKVAVDVSFTPDGGDENTESATVKLKRKRKK